MDIHILDEEDEPREDPERKATRDLAVVRGTNSRMRTWRVFGAKVD